MTNLGPLSFNNSGNPTSNLHVYSNSGTQAAPLIQFPNTAPPTVGVVYGGGGLDQGVDPNYRDPQSNQWSLTVERQLTANNSLRVSYVGMHTYRLSITEDLNQIPASTIPYNRVPLPASMSTSARRTRTGPRSTPPSTTAKPTTRHGDRSHASHGQWPLLRRQLHPREEPGRQPGRYPSSFAGEVNYGIPIADRFDIDSDYGNVEGTRRHRFLLTGVYQLPSAKAASISPMALAEPGRRRLEPQHHNPAGNRPLAHSQHQPWRLPGRTRPHHRPVPSAPPTASRRPTTSPTPTSPIAARSCAPTWFRNNFYAGQSRSHYFNLAAFSPTPVGAGRFGNAGVGILQGPGTAAVSLGLAKVFTVTESVHLRFESTFTNVLNHTNFLPRRPRSTIPRPSASSQLRRRQRTLVTEPGSSR